MRLQSHKQRNCGPRRFRSELEGLEDRCVPATIVVNHPGDFVDSDPNTTTLREALEMARNNTTDDTIQVNVSGTIELNGELVAGDYEFNGNDSGALTIEGNGIVLDAMGRSRVMRIEDGTVHVIGVTFQNGNADLGGGLIVLDGTDAEPTKVTLDNCKVINNTAKTAGGGIFSAGELHIINGSEVSNNFSRSNGGGVAVFGERASLTAIDSVFSDNEAGKKGGAVYNDGGAVSVATSTFSGNQARKGNDIYSTGGTLEYDESADIDVVEEEAGSKGGGGKGKGGKPKG